MSTVFIIFLKKINTLNYKDHVTCKLIIYHAHRISQHIKFNTKCESVKGFYNFVSVSIDKTHIKVYNKYMKTKKGGMNMSTNINEYITTCCAKNNISQAELARRLGVSRQCFNIKFHNKAYKYADLEKIANVFNADVNVSFVDKTTGKPIY